MAFLALEAMLFEQMLLVIAAWMLEQLILLIGASLGVVVRLVDGSILHNLGSFDKLF